MHYTSLDGRTEKLAESIGILASNNSPTLTNGTRSLTLNLGLRLNFRWVFMIANVSNPILGADILNHYGLAVDMHG